MISNTQNDADDNNINRVRDILCSNSTFSDNKPTKSTCMYSASVHKLPIRWRDRGSKTADENGATTWRIQRTIPLLSANGEAPSQNFTKIRSQFLSNPAYKSRLTVKKHNLVCHFALAEEVKAHTRYMLNDVEHIMFNRNNSFWFYGRRTMLTDNSTRNNIYSVQCCLMSTWLFRDDVINDVHSFTVCLASQTLCPPRSNTIHL